MEQNSFSAPTPAETYLNYLLEYFITPADTSLITYWNDL